MCQNFDLTHKPPQTHCLGSLVGNFFFKICFHMNSQIEEEIDIVHLDVFVG